MICANCGKDIPDNSKFCDYCGATITLKTNISDDELLELAEAYTANLAAAKEIVNQAKNKKDPHQAIFECALSYVKNKDSELFKEPEKNIDGQLELNKIDNIEDTLRPLTYEERFVVLMKCVENNSVEEIANKLNIKIDDVHGYLQSAYKKVYPNGKQEISKTMNVKEHIDDPVVSKAIKKGNKHPRKSLSKNNNNKSKSPLANKLKIIIAVVIACILGGWLGIKNYANGQYKSGIEDLNKENYDSAIKELSNAAQWWTDEKDVNKKLADAYAGANDYEKAVEKLELYINNQNDESANEQLAKYYCKLGENASEIEDYVTAKSWYEKAYAIDNNEFTNIKILAAENNGVYVDDNGNEYNCNAQLTKININENGNKYIVNLTYDENILTNVEVVNGSAKLIEFNKFNSSYENAEISIYPVNGALRYYVHEIIDENKENYYGTFGKYLYSKVTTKDNNDLITKVTSKNQETNEVITYEYKYTNDLLTSIYGTSTNNDDALLEEFTYDKNNKLIERRLSRNLLSTIERETYAYDDNGNCIRKIIERNEMSNETNLIPHADYQIIDYVYTKDGEIYSSTITDKNGTIVANGYGLEGIGIIYTYNS